jgi:hypothetical protein
VGDCAVAPEQRATAARITRAIRARIHALPLANSFYANGDQGQRQELRANIARMSIDAL